MDGVKLATNSAEFRVWAPHTKQVKLQTLRSGAPPADILMLSSADDIFHASTAAGSGDRYSYIVDKSQPVPDPVSRLLPQGVHGPTEIVPPESPWTDHAWRGLDLHDYIIYELHVGTFTPKGNFDGVIERLDYLKNLGITALELMPVAAFPGVRNWGYDGVSPYAVQASYGGPNALKRLVDAAHRAGIAVILDVVYNHLGNEGNYFRLFGPYFTDRHHTPWGEAINYDSPGCEHVREYFIENALYWIREYHFDGLRLDAIQTIHDDSPLHIVAAIQENVQRLAHELGRKVCVIAETDENNAAYVLPRSSGGMGLDAVWSDDFHHAIHALLTGEREGYYQDFGSKKQLVRALNEGFVFQGEFFKFWNRGRGTPSRQMPLPAHVICIQNHDQVGNRARGDRLSTLVPRGACKLAAALLLLAPETPLLFMGEEFGETTPFQFFTDCGDATLRKAVSEGRRNEFKDFLSFGGEVPDPQDPETFERSKLSWDLISSKNADMLDWYRQLIAIRKKFLSAGGRTCDAQLIDGTITVRTPAVQPRILITLQFPDSKTALPRPPGNWDQLLSSDEDGYHVYVARGL